MPALELALPAAAARQVGLEEDAPGLIMEVRGFTLRDRPLYYQTVYAPPFGERLVIVR